MGFNSGFKGLNICLKVSSRSKSQTLRVLTVLLQNETDTTALLFSLRLQVG